jgi:hypothetical protein
MDMRRGLLGAMAVVLLVGAFALAAEKPKLEIKHIWFYCHPNLAVDKSLADTIALMQRAAQAGYTGIVLVENKMQRWSQVTPQYLENMKKFRQACRDNKLDCVAAVTPLGYANDLLSNDPNLAEGMPVVDAPFVVKGGKLVPDDPTTLIRRCATTASRRSGSKTPRSMTPSTPTAGPGRRSQ